MMTTSRTAVPLLVVINAPGARVMATTSSTLTDPVTSVADVKIETNRGRSFRLTNDEDLYEMATQSTGRVITRRLEATKGTTITGLYAHQSPGMNSDFMTLGVMSEAL
ncbi:hypothetical protein FJTKL_12663 [Diaporthe vaccinii]|uniref:Uncharacterized protein n=1 Tax=Diaporthe vaccinii TaxID=105482 RepID=A0ABR4ED20_9PEZI